MTTCENIDGQCGASWCDCDYQRRKRTAEPCYYCSGPHEDDPCPVRVADAERYRRQGEAMYRNPVVERQWEQWIAGGCPISQQWICGLERDNKPDSK